jgi:hypothetical protein
VTDSGETALLKKKEWMVVELTEDLWDPSEKTIFAVLTNQVISIEFRLFDETSGAEYG